jgi:hypothetical protein
LLLELQLWYDQTNQFFRHLFGNDVGFYKLFGRSRFIGIPQLDHGLDWVKLD